MTVANLTTTYIVADLTTTNQPLFYKGTMHFYKGDVFGCCNDLLNGMLADLSLGSPLYTCHHTHEKTNL